MLDGSTCLRPGGKEPGSLPGMTERADVVVVGGGIIGCGVAAELASRGVSVVLVERSQIGAGASGRNHGLIFLPEESELHHLARVSLGLYAALADESSIDLSLDEVSRAPRGARRRSRLSRNGPCPTSAA